MSAVEQVQDAEVIEETTEPAPASGTDLVSVGAAGTIIRAEQPAEILAKATEIANALKNLVDQQGLAVEMGGRKKHVEVGAWQALGALLGALGGQPLHAETAWSRPVGGENPRLTTYHVQETRKKWGKVDGRRQIVEETVCDYDVEGFDWEARVEIRTASGVVVGVAEAMCSRAETSWMRKPDPAVKSMAETRAESRAYRRAVGWLMVIAGYNPTPAEEMPPTEPEPTGPPFGEAAPEKLRGTMERAFAWLLDCEPDSPLVADLFAALERDGGGYLPRVSLRAAGLTINALKQALHQAGDPKAAIGGDESGD